ncbi:hypothetical protein, partial [Pedobacter sp. ASV12]|uniref:hypothetical protein n=1 Tax=Pedobacter sp. ASV12 TaxID=2795120 RepID=UPI0018ED9C1C
MKYGIDKVLLQQFSTPEANILYTPFGNLDKDILLWSTFGTSKFYNVAIGFVEVFVALLLFFRSTRLVGFYMSLALFLNICIINFGFDISVKTFSLFLLLVITINISPSLKQVYAFFVRQQFVQLKSDQEALKLPYHHFVKPVLLLCIGWYILSPIAWAFNSSTQLSPFNGAYEVCLLYTS